MSNVSMMILDSLNTAKAGVVSAKYALLGAEKRYRDAVAGAKELILGGRSTGNAVRDHVIVKFEDNDEEYARYQQLQTAFEGKVGELFIGYYDEQICTKHVFYGEGNEYETVTHFYVGIVGSDQLIFQRDGEKSLCRLPLQMYRFFAATGRTQGPLPLLMKGALLENAQGLGHYAACTADWATGKQTPDFRRTYLTCIIGDEAVREFCALNSPGSPEKERFGRLTIDRLLKKKKGSESTEELNQGILSLVEEFAGRLQLTVLPETTEESGS